MFYQNAKKVNPFRHYGCYYFSLGKIAEMITGEELSTADIFETYILSCENGWMNPNCFIYAAEDILQCFVDILSESGLWDISFVGWWNKDTGKKFWNGEQYNYTVERYDYGSYNHFRLADWEPHFGSFNEKNKGLNGERYFLATRGNNEI